MSGWALIAASAALQATMSPPKPPPILEVDLIAPPHRDEAATNDEPAPSGDLPIPKLLNPAGLVGSDDYPLEARRNGETGAVSVEVAVDADGKPTACKIMATSGSSSLDAATCSLVMARARFAPASKDGKPVAAPFTQTIVWKLPPGGWQDLIGRTVFTVAKGNKPGACRLEQIGPARIPISDAAFCAHVEPVAAEALATLPKDEDHAGQELVMEKGFIGGGADALPVGLGRDERLFSRWAVEIVRDEKGKVVSCKPGSLEEMDAAMIAYACDRHIAKRTTPAGMIKFTPLKTSIYEVIFLRPALRYVPH